MRFLAQFPVGFVLLLWPMAVMMSPMVLDAPDSDTNKSNLVPLALILFYPALFGAAFYFLNWSFFSYSPRTFLIASISVPVAAFVLFGYPRIVLNMLRGVPSIGYGRTDSGVYYDGSALVGADQGSFEPLGGFGLYARDRAHVYYRGKVIERAHPASFLAVPADHGESAYWRDASHVFHDGRVVEGADPATFVAAHRYGYAHDRERVFYRGEVLRDADTASFRLLNDSVAADRTHIYFLGNVILSNADAASFEVLGSSSYARDASKVYALPGSDNGEAQVVVGADRATFTPMSRGYAKDANHVYTSERGGPVVLEGADAASFKVTEWDEATQSEARDKLHRYLQGKIVAH